MVHHSQAAVDLGREGEEMHYSFDYAQQMQFPTDPDQPGPMYFLCPRKCGLFGVTCDGTNQQVNYLIDEGMSSCKGSNSVISYLHDYFKHYGKGERVLQLHCDNCGGQNKNRFVMSYLAWRTIHGLHDEISVHFMVSGHTKFSPDRAFGLIKHRFHRDHPGVAFVKLQPFDEETISISFVHQPSSLHFSCLSQCHLLD